MKRIKDFIAKTLKPNDPSAKLNRFLIHLAIGAVACFFAIRIILGELTEKLAALKELLNSI